ncbi:MAG TPA: fibronectin type III domain-containing protein, partial [Candidatus Thermoplasmatota archaeon]|nr:fibronectin type III domain-containing protein [Candidatus Thermoplasmatota archaeon]
PVTLASPQPGDGWATERPVVTLDATDAASGVLRTEWRLRGDDAFATYEGPFALPDGAGLVVEYRSVDVAGNVEAIREVGPYDVDATLPPAPVLDALPPFLPADAVTLRWTASDGGASAFGAYVVRQRAGEGDWEDVATLDDPDATTLRVEGLQDGVAYAWRVVATRASGASAAGPVVAATVDLVAPAVEAVLADDPGDGWLATDAPLRLSASDATSGVAEATYRLLQGDAVLAEGALPADVTLPEGESVVAWRAVDAAGHETAGSRTLRADRVAPTVAAALAPQPNAAGWRNGEVTVTLSAEDATSGVARVQHSLDGETWEDGDVVTLVGPGHVTLAWRAIDRAGHVSAVGGAVIPIDATAPAVTAALDGENAAGWAVTDAPLRLAVDDATSGVAAATYVLRAGDETLAEGALPAEVDLPEGADLVVSWRAEDVAGNVATGERALRVDRTAPTVQLALAPEANEAGWRAGDVTATLTASDAASGVARVETSLDGGQTWQAGATRILQGPGLVTLQYRAVDAAGHASPVGEASVRIDQGKPVITLVPADGLGDAWRRGPVNVTLAVEAGPSGVGRVEAELDGAPVDDVENDITVSGEGVHTLRARATSASGVPGDWATLVVRIDATPPTSEASVPAPGGQAGWHVAPVPVALTGADATSGLARVEHRVGDGAWTTGPLLLDASGVHVVRHRAVDASG